MGSESGLRVSLGAAAIVQVVAALAVTVRTRRPDHQVSGSNPAFARAPAWVRVCSTVSAGNKANQKETEEDEKRDQKGSIGTAGARARALGVHLPGRFGSMISPVRPGPVAESERGDCARAYDGRGMRLGHDSDIVSLNSDAMMAQPELANPFKQ